VICLSIAVVILTLVIMVLGASVPFLWYRTLQADRKMEELDTAIVEVQETLKAAMTASEHRGKWQA